MKNCSKLRLKWSGLLFHRLSVVQYRSSRKILDKFREKELKNDVFSEMMTFASDGITMSREREIASF